MIYFNVPYLTGKETHYIYDAVKEKKLSGNGKYTKLCHNFFKEKYGFNNCFLTSSCTDALEMAAILLDLKPGDEVIVPSYTFVSTANPFILRGAKIIFADSCEHSPHIDPEKIESLVTNNTKAIVVVHYAGIACDMDKIMEVAQKHNLYVIEDAAQAIDGYYNNKPLGSIGHLSTFSFHETKNIISGEGGLLVVNDKKMVKRAEVIWEKGTNRAAFWRGEVDKYNWVDIGSSFLPSEVIAAFLYAQLEHIDDIQSKRKALWNQYYEQLSKADSSKVKLPLLPEYSSNNAHIFYLVCDSLETRSKLIDYLKSNNVNSVFHYLSLHKSPFYKEKYSGAELPNSDMYSDCLVRLPLYYELTFSDVNKITTLINTFFN